MSQLIKTATRWLFFIALVFFISGLFSLLRSKPELDIVPAATGSFSYPGPKKNPPTMKVETIASPFSPEVLPTVEIAPVETVTVESQLMILGTLAGKNPRAIVAERSDPSATKIVKVGDEIAGEKILSIGKGFIEVMTQGQKVRVEQ